MPEGAENTLRSRVTTILWCTTPNRPVWSGSMGEANTNLSLRVSVSVAASAVEAFGVFTERLDAWWVREFTWSGPAGLQTIAIEPAQGGKAYEVGPHGFRLDWGRVLVWEPETRLVLSWDITADWQYDPALGTEIEIRFILEGEHRTRVELEHRKLDRYGARREQMRRVFDTEGDWGRLLQGFAAVAARAG